MLHLQRDVFVRLAISAQKNKDLNKPFRVVHAESWSARPSKIVEMPSKLDEEVSNVSTTTSSFPVAKFHKVEKIDEKVDKMISDPALLEIKAELEFAEELLKKIKERDSKNPKISSIEQTVSQLKQLLEQKMYV